MRPNEDHAEIARAHGHGKMIEVEAYPQIAPTGRLVAEKGSSKPLFEAVGPVALRTKVWLDPIRGFVAVRQENDFVDAPREVARSTNTATFAKRRAASVPNDPLEERAKAWYASNRRRGRPLPD